ncbi:hypothetical protein GCM10018952_56290 [Streptosporangium vulgare]
MEVTDRADGVTVINDAYNANPDSMRAAFGALDALAGDRRRFAVVAALRELGDESVALNEGLGRLAGSAGLAGLFVVGPDADPVLAGARAAVQAAGRVPAASGAYHGAGGPPGGGAGEPPGAGRAGRPAPVAAFGDPEGSAAGGTPAVTRVSHAADAAQAGAELAAMLAPGDVVLVKGPRAAGLERVAAALLGGDRR